MEIWTPIGEFFAPEYVVHLTDEELVLDHEGIKRLIHLYQRAFNQIQVEVETLVVSKDRIAWQRTMRATHHDSFKGFPGTGKQMIWRDMVTSRFENGLISEDWLITDLAERLLLARKSKRSSK